MKKKDKRFSGYWLLAGLLSLFGVFCLWETPCSAYDLVNGGSTDMWDVFGSRYEGQTTVNISFRQSTVGSNTRFWRYDPTNNVPIIVNEIWMAPKYIPANSIIHLSLRISQNSNTDPLGFEGLSAEGMGILSRSCINMAQSQENSTGQFTKFIQCDYWVYNDNSHAIINNGSGQFSYLVLKGDIYFPANSSFVLDVMDQVDFIELAQPLSQSSIDGLSSDITSALADLEIAVEGSGGATPAQIQNAAETAITNALEEEKEQYEEQQNDVSDGADDAGDAAEAATSSLISNTRNIIETIRDTPATDCNIRIQRGGFDTGNLNLCDVPETVRTVISSIIVIPVTLAALHIAYTTVMLYLNTVRKEQE